MKLAVNFQSKFRQVRLAELTLGKRRKMDKKFFKVNSGRNEKVDLKGIIKIKAKKKRHDK